METFNSILFKQFFEKVNGANINIDFSNRRLTILSNEGKICATVLFSRSLENNFTVGDLFNKGEIGVPSYYVYVNAGENIHYLWFRSVLEEL